MLDSSLHFLRKASVLSVKNPDILNNSEKSPQMLTLLCASISRTTTKLYPEDPSDSQSPYTAQLAMDAF